jgi:competence protein ComEC
VPRAAWLAVGGCAAAYILVAGLGVGGSFVGLVTAATLAVTGVGFGLAVLRRRPGLAAASAGAWLVAARIGLGVALAPPPQPPPETGVAEIWTARVASIGTPAAGEQRAVLELSEPALGIVHARLPRYPILVPGDRIRFHAALDEPPNGSGFADYLRRIGASATVEIRGFDLLAGAEDGAAVEHLRRAADAALAAVLPEPEAGLAAGIVIGLRDRVDRGVAADLTTAGLSHVVAISGWNIAIVVSTLSALLRGWPRRRRIVATLVFVAVYTILAGASPSVVRAALMTGLVLTVRETGRPGRAAMALGLAVAAMLLVDPGTIDDPGFQLSVTATAGLLAWGTPLAAWLKRHLPSRAPAWLVESLGVSLAAQAATLPLVLLAFGRLSLISPLANLAAAPLVAPAMAVGVAAMIVGGVVLAGAPAFLAVPIAVAGRVLFGGIVAVGHTAASVPLASLTLEGPGALAVAGGTAGLLALGGTAYGRAALRGAIGRGGRARPARHQDTAVPLPGRGSSGPSRRPRPSFATRVAVIGLALLVGAVALGAVARPDGRLRLTVLDIGQGDAILLEGDRGTRLLVDTGPDPDRLLAVLDARLPPWDRRIDLVVITHPHEDHVAGLALLLTRYQVGAIAEPGMRGSGPGYRAYREVLARLKRTSGRLFAGDRLRLDSAEVEVRWPPRGAVPAEPPDTGTGINNVSIVLDVHFGERRLLLTGDVEQAIDPQLLAAGLADGDSLDVLKVAHHGSRTASTEALLAALRPRLAIISAGTGNPYGHPTRQTLDRLEAVNARTFRTDLDGSVTVDTDGHDLHVRASGGRHTAAQPPSRDPADAALALFRCDASRISPWPSPIGVQPPRSSPPSDRPTGTSATSPAWPRWPPSLPPVWRHAASASIAAWSRPPRSSTTWTASSPRTIRSRRSDTARPVAAGSSSTATASWRARSPPTPSRA